MLVVGLRGPDAGGELTDLASINGGIVEPMPMSAAAVAGSVSQLGEHIRTHFAVPSALIAPTVSSGCDGVNVSFLPSSVTVHPGDRVSVVESFAVTNDAAPGTRQCVFDLGILGRRTHSVEVIAPAPITEATPPVTDAPVAPAPSTAPAP